ncbi:MAG: GTPase [Marinobacter sp.]|nr:GTPase [Marinobacter sp.]
MVAMILKPDLQVPEQKSTTLSFCDVTPKSFKHWADNLPIANVGESSRQLYHAIIELNQLLVAPAQRMGLLEIIRPRIHFVCRELSRHYLGMAISLPEKQRKIANLSQALQLHLANGYKICILEFLDQGGLDRNRKALAPACHRAITELGMTLLRSSQLYCASPARTWLETHRIYRFTQRNKLSDIECEDDTLNHRDSSTVADAYKRLLLLACARPNQLRQKELEQSYELFELWSSHVECSPELAKQNSLFVINMERDAPPVYRSLIQGDMSHDNFGFDTTTLSDLIADHVNRLQDKKGDPQAAASSALRVAGNMPDMLLMHLSQALGVLTKRSFNRIASEGSLQVTVGMTATHFYIADKQTFNQFVAGNEDHADEGRNRFIDAASRKDAWSGAHDASPSDDRLYSADAPITYRGVAGAFETPDSQKTLPPIYRTHLINSSPGGYCIGWDGEVPASLQSGEILGIREHERHPWSVAVVRWMRQVRNQGMQVGIELLAPSAAPCGIKLIQKAGQSSEYLRGLLLPEISSVSRSATILTPRLPFQSGSRVTLIHDNQEQHGMLLKRLLSTGSVSQFELKLHTQIDTDSGEPRTSGPGKKSGGASEDEFDSLWPSL